MISTLAIIRIFLQIFATCIAISGFYSFVIRYYKQRKKEDLYLSLIFISLSVYTALTVISQIIYTLDISAGIRFALHRVIAIDLVIGSLFVAYFIKEKFSYKGNLLVRIYMFVCIIQSYLYIRSPLNIIENIKDLVVDPGIHFLYTIPSDWFWNILFLLLAIKLFSVARTSRTVGEKNIYWLSGISSLLFSLSFIPSYFYAKSGQTYYLLGFWLIYLCAATGFFLGNIISTKDDIARFPLSYFRTRILYKLVLIFILLIVILLEATTIATINLNQMSLQKAIKNNYLIIARNIADKIEYMTNKEGSLNVNFVQGIVDQETIGKRQVYIVSNNGKIFVISSQKPQEVGRDMSSAGVVKKVLAGKDGVDEYISESFAAAQDQHVIGAFAPVKKYGLGVIIEDPAWMAYSDVRLVSTNTLILVIVGIFMTVSAGIFFAKSIESSINEVIIGTEAVGKGDYSYKIKINSIDEIGHLADAFNQMTKELKQSQEHLISSEKLASLGTMAAGMAHEIKNPLVSLRTFTQLLPQRFEDEEFRRKFATVVPQEIDKINKIAESLLRFGRPHKPELTQVSVNEILDEILALFDNEARKNNVKITTKLADIPKITADAGQISQALVNIILNAIQAMQNGGELSVKTDAGEVIRLGSAARAAEDGAEEEAKPAPVVFIEVSDTGLGIPEENLNKIFDPFFTTKEVGGTGMGLPITLRIIEDHHGSIKVRSQVGKGTTFLITLPQTQEAAV